jgi:hypothetical protein
MRHILPEHPGSAFEAHGIDPETGYLLVTHALIAPLDQWQCP